MGNRKNECGKSHLENFRKVREKCFSKIVGKSICFWRIIFFLQTTVKINPSTIKFAAFLGIFFQNFKNISFTWKGGIIAPSPKKICLPSPHIFGHFGRERPKWEKNGMLKSPKSSRKLETKLLSKLNLVVVLLWFCCVSPWILLLLFLFYFFASTPNQHETFVAKQPKQE